MLFPKPSPSPSPKEFYDPDRVRKGRCPSVFYALRQASTKLAVSRSLFTIVLDRHERDYSYRSRIVCFRRYCTAKLCPVCVVAPRSTRVRWTIYIVRVPFYRILSHPQSSTSFWHVWNVGLVSSNSGILCLGLGSLLLCSPALSIFWVTSRGLFGALLLALAFRHIVVIGWDFQLCVLSGIYFSLRACAGCCAAYLICLFSGVSASSSCGCQLV